MIRRLSRGNSLDLDQVLRQSKCRARQDRDRSWCSVAPSLLPQLKKVWQVVRTGHEERQLHEVRAGQASVCEERFDVRHCLPCLARKVRLDRAIDGDTELTGDEEETRASTACE